MAAGWGGEALTERAVAANQRAVGEEVDREVPRPDVVFPSLEELVREGFSAHFVECDQYLAHADERPRLAGAVAESLPDRTRLLEGRERRLVLAGVVEEEPTERFQRRRGLLPIAELRPTDDRLLQP